MDFALGFQCWYLAFAILSWDPLGFTVLVLDQLILPHFAYKAQCDTQPWVKGASRGFLGLVWYKVMLSSSKMPLPPQLGQARVIFGLLGTLSSP